MGNKTLKIPLSKLKTSVENPRFESTSTDEEAVTKMFKEMGEELFHIAKDLVKNGQNPSTIIVLYQKEDGSYVLKDGNRRVTAMRAIINPKIIPEEFSNDRSRFEKLSLDPSRPDFKKIKCVIFDDEDEADKWVHNNHAGTQGGVGQITWGPIQDARFNNRKGTKNINALNLLEYISKKSPDIQISNEFPLTTLTRLLNSIPFKSAIGLKIKNGIMLTDLSEEDFLKEMREVIVEFDTKKRNVSDVINKERIENYIENERKIGRFCSKHTETLTNIIAGKNTVDEIIDSPDDLENETSEQSEGVKESETKENNKSVKRPKKVSKYKFFENVDLTLLDSDPRCVGLKNVMIELKDLSEAKGSQKPFEKYPLAAGMVLRTAYDQSMKLLLKKNKLEKNVPSKLSELEGYVGNRIGQWSPEPGAKSDDAIGNYFEIITRGSICGVKGTWRDVLNATVHAPGSISITPQMLETITQGGMRTFIERIIAYPWKNE